MKLVDLEPSWLKVDGHDGMGLKFSCPCCRKIWIYVFFLNPIGGNPSVPRGTLLHGENWGNRWARSGMTFDDLTLSPAIDASKAGHWKGKILDGELQSLTSVLP